MDNKEVEKVLEELQEVRPEKLTGEAKRLFEAIMKIADRKDEAESDLYEANNRINDLLDIVKQKDKMIDLMANEILEQDRLNQDDINHYDNKHEVLKYFEERCK